MRNKREKRRLRGILENERETAKKKDSRIDKKLTPREITIELIRARISRFVSMKSNIFIAEYCFQNSLWQV